MTNPIVADMRARAAEYRDQATEHHREAGELGDRIAEPAALLDRMAAEEADLVRRLEALRLEMVDVRRAYDAIDAERAHHAAQADAKTRAADYIEQRTLPDLAELLKPAPPHEQHAATGLMREEPKPVDPMDGPQGDPFHVRDCRHCGGDISYNRLTRQWEHLRDDEAGCWPDEPDTPIALPDEPGLDDPPGEVVAAVTGGTPIIHDPDVLDGKTPITTLTDRPGERSRHAAPRESRVTGAWRTITGRVTAEHDDEQADGQ